MNEKTLLTITKTSKERGYTLLEYAAGAALIAIIVGVTISAIGNGFENLGNSIGAWATREGTELEATNP